ncbi:hypothetical protein L3Y34_017840 [Caenorhabditis briggsae]|uniref:SKP1 component POZ domain-containing protein n=1 Tax=Caenorhabditis briggsae TaxID=6238 RepID=A0AAE9DIK8_CAEBR|nr:hypothetical protein L3Y34_017840 [Caenorhabditis briggsae]
MLVLKTSFLQRTMTTDEPSSSISQELITVVSSDGKDFELTVELAQQSETLAKLIANFDYHLKDVKKEPIPLGNIASAQMEKVCVWLKHHQNKKWTPPGKSDVPSYSFDKWTNAYLTIPNSELFELMSAANYLNIQHLYETLCRRIASKIAGKTSSEMRQALNLKSDEEIKAAEIDEEEEEEKEEDDESSSEDQEMSDISLSPEPPIND